LLVCRDAHTTVPRTGNATGIDVGLMVFPFTADGQVVENPRHYHLRVSGSMKGSTRRTKTGKLCAKLPQRIRRQCTDIPHTTALALVRRYDVIDHEAI
jgi:transposase